jgi:mitogen-activated protein kinase 7
MSDLQVQGRKVFKVFNQDFVVDDRYTVTKELGQGAYGIVWYVLRQCPAS